MVELSAATLLFFLAALFAALLAVFVWLLRYRHAPLTLKRLPENPILTPDPTHWWESQAVFNPAALVHDGQVHLFYRALGGDGVSRVGHAASDDGIHFGERTLAYEPGPGFIAPQHKTSKEFSYQPGLYASGGGWGGVEDPRAVKTETHVYLSFGIFENWQSLRLALTSLPLGHMAEKLCQWAPHFFLSPPGETHKNWVLFPEKIRGRFALLHALSPEILIEYFDDLEEVRTRPVQSNNRRSGRAGAWDAFARGAGAPPIKTPHGWLLLYHGMDPARGPGYNVGAMLLDLEDPTKILYRTNRPILEPTTWYENGAICAIEDL